MAPETVTASAPQAALADSLRGLQRIAIIPAYNEAESIASVIQEVRRADADLDVVVIDDGSTDRTARIAARAGARVVRLPFNLGIGGAMQTGYQYARDHGFQVAVQIDGDGQHDPFQVEKLLKPILEGRADLVIGSRFAGEGGYRSGVARRIGIRLFARAVSLIIRQRVTDATSGFRAANRRAICLFAADYPHDYPEVEATVLVFRHELRFVEVPVVMRDRVSGRSSITPFRGFYYMLKVSLALFVGLFRRYSTPMEEP